MTITGTSSSLAIAFKLLKMLPLLYREPNTVIAHEIDLKTFFVLNHKLMIDIEFLDIKKDEYKIITEGPLDNLKVKFSKTKTKNE